jgi:hypothetical protein
MANPAKPHNRKTSYVRKGPGDIFNGQKIKAASFVDFLQLSETSQVNIRKMYDS